MIKKSVFALMSVLLSVGILGGCGKVEKSAATPLETPVETPVEDTYIEDFVVPEIMLGVKTATISELTQEEMAEGKKLAGAFADFMVMNFENREDEKLGGAEKMMVEKFGRNLTRNFLASLNKYIEKPDTEEDENRYVIEEREDGSQVREDPWSSSIGNVVRYGKYDDSNMVYAVERIVPIKEYTSKEAEDGTFIRNEVEPFYIFLSIESGEIRLAGFSYSKSSALKVLTEEEILKYELGKPIVLEKPMYDTGEAIWDIGGRYWGEDKEVWKDGELEFDLRALYPNSSDKTTTYTFTLYNNTKDPISGKYAILVNKVSYKYQELNSETLVEEVGDLGDLGIEIVELNLAPGESTVYQFKVLGENWLSESSKRADEYDNGKLKEFYHSWIIKIQKIVE